jgi:hypothetical protein
MCMAVSATTRVVETVASARMVLHRYVERTRTMHRENSKLTAIVAGAIFVGACGASTTLEQGWSVQAGRTQPAHLTRVVTVFDSSSVAMDRAAEDRLASDLGAHGVAATPGYAVLSDSEQRVLAGIGQRPSKELDTVNEKLQGMGYDGVVTMRIVDREQSLRSTYDGGWGYPSYWYWGGYYSGYTYTVTTYRVDTSAYSLRTHQLVWSGLIRSEDPSSTHKMISDTSRIVTKELVDRDLAG